MKTTSRLLAAVAGTVLSLSIAGSAAAFAPPGPFDLLRGIFGGGFQSCSNDQLRCSDRDNNVACCSRHDRCCQDAEGPYCCSGGERYSRAERHHAPPPPPSYGCAPAEIACSQDGQTVCCPNTDQCCAGQGGPACCALPAPGYGPPSGDYY